MELESGLDDRLDNIDEGKRRIKSGGRCHVLTEGTREEGQSCGNVSNAWKLRCVATLRWPPGTQVGRPGD